ncbi:MAG: TIGR03936 family radical SAM-associated protein [Planctomycetota bacterium]|nr:TIGR03936 family radical SAM-associated protein [Planctomycetota bacterium]
MAGTQKLGNCEGTTQNSPQRWAIRLAVSGDLRFISHLDMMRLIRLVAARAQLPLRYSQGFNPHPILSLPCARPVGIASQDELLMLSLDGPIEPELLLARLNSHAPRGLRFFQAFGHKASRTPKTRQCRYELNVCPERLGQVGRRLGELHARDRWPVERHTTSRGRSPTTRQIDLKPLISNITLQDGLLRVTLVPKGDLWARPGEVLRLLDLDARVDLAEMVRTAVECEI